MICPTLLIPPHRIFAIRSVIIRYFFTILLPGILPLAKVCAQCNLVDINLSTGISNSGASLPPGSTDPNWQSAQGMNIVTAPNIFWNTMNGSAWLGNSTNANNTAIFTYTRNFSTPATGTMYLQALADNYIELYLDGTPIAQTPGLNMNGFQLAYVATYSGSVPPGNHTLQALVHNITGPSGLNLNGHISYLKPFWITEYLTLCTAQLPFYWRGTYIPAGSTSNPSFSTVTVTDPSGCDSVITLNLNVVPFLTGTQSASICQGQSFTFNGVSYASGNNTARDTFISAGGCDSIVTLDLTVIPATGSIQTVEICEGESYIFKGVIYTTSNNTARDTFISTAGCDSIVSLDLTVNPLPDVRIQTDNTDVFCLSQATTLQATGAANYLWQDVTGVPIGSGEQLQIQLTNPFTHIMLTGINGLGCSDTISIDLSARICCMVEMPGAFSPNNDGLNDTYGPVTTEPMKRFSLTIRNRWGQEVFHSLRQEDHWDGTLNGRKADMGTYFYYLTGECSNGNKTEKKGNFILLR